MIVDTLGHMLFQTIHDHEKSGAAVALGVLVAEG
jgi:hypothetical protein